VRLSVEIEPDLRTRIRRAAAAQKLSVRDFVEASLRRSLATDEPDEAAAWAQLCAAAFARDWASEEDAIYDRLPSGDVALVPFGFTDGTGSKWDHDPTGATGSPAAQQQLPSR
jgi:hypothetical protein